jgi:XTP/dITP diphosphohydrolase
MRFILASYNRHKAQEIRLIVAPVNVETLADLGIDIPLGDVEDGETYEENAFKKVREVAAHVKGIVVSDDSGLEVDALGGRPGIHSARYGGAGLTDRERCELLLRETGAAPGKTLASRFVCVVAARLENGVEHAFRWILEGMITHECRGESGFGYDPVFFLPDRGLTVAEIGPEEKNRISHRARAFTMLRDFLLKGDPR